MTRLYFDYAATTPLDRRVTRVMRSFFDGKFGNPSSLHSFGQEAIAAVDGARERIAGLLGAGFREIIFTGSATEANNLALRGVVAYARQLSRGTAVRSLQGQAPGCPPCLPAGRSAKKPLKATPSFFASESFRSKAAGFRQCRVIVSAVEHESVLETARDLEKEAAAEVIYLPVDKNGRVSLPKLKQALNDRTVLVSVMYANNELGTIQPIAEIADIIRNFREQKAVISEQDNGPWPLFHTDAAQAFQYLDCGVNRLGVDLMTLSGHKIYGPKGIGVLYVRNLKPETYNLKPILTGGGQEFGLRSGTENVPLIVGMAEAMEITAKTREKETKRIAGLRDHFLRGLKKIYPKAELNGPSGTNAFLPNIVNLFFPDYPADELATQLDLLGIAVGTGSACASRAPEASHVLRAVGFSEERAKHSIRISFGRPVTKAQIDTFLKCVRKLTGYVQ